MTAITVKVQRNVLYNLFWTQYLKKYSALNMNPTPKHPSTYDRLLARERVNATPAPAKPQIRCPKCGGMSVGCICPVCNNQGTVDDPESLEEVTEIVLPPHTPIHLSGSIMHPRVPRQIPLPATKEACTHPRITRTGRCFWCGIIVADLA